MHDDNGERERERERRKEKEKVHGSSDWRLISGGSIINK
jgi:hypothetical protein